MKPSVVWRLKTAMGRDICSVWWTRLLSCCLTHSRAKFKYALEQGGDKDTAFFLDTVGELYHLEAEYEDGKLSAEQILTCRQNLETKEIIIRLRIKLDAILSNMHPSRGKLMEKALNFTWILSGFNFLLTSKMVLVRSTIPLRNDSYAHCPVSARTPYSLAVTRWREYLQLTIRSYPPARCRAFLHCDTLKCFCRQSLTDVGIMRIFFPWLSDWVIIDFKNQLPFWAYLMYDRLLAAIHTGYVKIGH